MTTTEIIAWMEAHDWVGHDRRFAPVRPTPWAFARKPSVVRPYFTFAQIGVINYVPVYGWIKEVR